MRIRQACLSKLTRYSGGGQGEQRATMIDIAQVQF